MNQMLLCSAPSLWCIFLLKAVWLWLHMPFWCKKQRDQWTPHNFGNTEELKVRGTLCLGKAHAFLLLLFWNRALEQKMDKNKEVQRSVAYRMVFWGTHGFFGCLFKVSNGAAEELHTSSSGEGQGTVIDQDDFSSLALEWERLLREQRTFGSTVKRHSGMQKDFCIPCFTNKHLLCIVKVLYFKNNCPTRCTGLM